MIRVQSIYISPIKSLALAPRTRAYIDKSGIAGDRAFFIIDAHGNMFTQRTYGPLVQVRTGYEPESGRLDLSFPDGSTVSGIPELGDSVAGNFFGREVTARIVDGEWGAALSTFAGQELRLAKAETPGTSFDAFPISMCSTASLETLARAAGTDAVDGRRFRQNLYIEGTQPHEEDSWLDGQVRVGKALLNVKMRDSRCEVTTLDPETGETDMDTLKIITSYRTDQPKQVNFGVYCTIAEPGEVSVGDEVLPVA